MRPERPSERRTARGTVLKRTFLQGFRPPPPKKKTVDPLAVDPGKPADRQRFPGFMGTPRVGAYQLQTGDRWWSVRGCPVLLHGVPSGLRMLMDRLVAVFLRLVFG